MEIREYVKKPAPSPFNWFLGNLTIFCRPSFVKEDENDTQFTYNKEALLITQWGGCLLESHRDSEAEPSVSPTLWPTEHALKESVPGRKPEQDSALPDIQACLQSTVARSGPDPHF